MPPILSKQSVVALEKGKYQRQVATFLDNKVEIAATRVLENGSTELFHFHENPHLCFILNGGVIDKRNNSEKEVRSGELMFFHAGEPHHTIYKQLPETNINIEIDRSFFADRASGETGILESLSKKASTKFTALRIYRELIVSDAYSDCSIEMLLLNLLDDEDHISKVRPQWLDRVIELLHDRWNDQLSLKELSEAANVYPTTISKHFPKYISCTLGEYRRRLKIEKSLCFIKSSGLPLTEIAYQCGFADQSHFTRTFKQMTGLGPRQYSVL